MVFVVFFRGVITRVLHIGFSLLLFLHFSQEFRFVLPLSTLVYKWLAEKRNRHLKAARSSPTMDLFLIQRGRGSNTSSHFMLGILCQTSNNIPSRRSRIGHF